MELPDVQKFYDENKDNINVVVVFTRRKTNLSSTKKYVEENKFTFPVYFDADDSIMKGFKINSIPYNIKIENSTIENYVLEQISQSNPMIPELKKYVGKIKIPASKPKDFLIIGNLYLALSNKLHAKVAQIKQYDWLDLNMVFKCHSNMDIILDTEIKFEVPIISDESSNSFIYEHDEFGKIYVSGRIDAMDSDTIWEFKCVDNLTLEHKLQLIIYAWAYYKSIMLDLDGKKNFILLNI